MTGINIDGIEIFSSLGQGNTDYNLSEKIENNVLFNIKVLSFEYCQNIGNECVNKILIGFKKTLEVLKI